MTDRSDIAENYRIALNHCFHIRDEIQDIHPLLATLQPVAVAQDGVFFIFEPRDAERTYTLVAIEPAPIPVPHGVRAAFPLDTLNGRAACVVTDDAFDAPQGYVAIFHEFVHCQQWMHGEQELRETLPLARKAKADGDPMWEIAYPFPYADVASAGSYRRWMAATEAGDEAAARSQRSALRAVLSALDWDYLTWQEWKEGFARFIENRVRRRLRLPANRNGREGTFDRVTFYAGGAAYIHGLAAATPSLVMDLVELFNTTRRVPAPRKQGPKE